jgi:hypothetical protein
MKTIDGIEGLIDLDIDLIMFIHDSCPWIAEGWDPESTGFVFLLDDNDSHKVTSICTVPHLPENKTDDKDSMTIDLAIFDLWEAPVYYDPTTGYWNVVAILGQEYGCALFMSSGFVESIPALHERLQNIKSTRRNIM